jgi:hypothetical protein
MGRASNACPFGVRKVDPQHTYAQARPLSQKWIVEVIKMAKAAFDELWTEANNLTLLKVFAEHGHNESTHGTMFADVTDGYAWRA